MLRWTTSKAARRGLELVADRRGASMTEYIIIVGVIAMVALNAFRTFGRHLRFKVDQQTVTITQVESG